MKHEQLFRRVIADVHIEWMDESTKEEQIKRDNKLILEYGEQMDIDIDDCLANGYSEDVIYEIVENVFLA